MKSAFRNIALRNDSRALRLLQCGTALQGALAAALLATPANAACTVEGDTTTCTGDLSNGAGTSTPNVVVSDVTTDITAPAGTPGFWLPGAASVQIDLGDHVLNGRDVPAVAVITDRAATVDFTGTIEVTGGNTANGGASGINVSTEANGGFDATLRSAGDITVNATRDADVSPYGNAGLMTGAGANGVASTTSTGDISVTVGGEPAIVLGVGANGGAGANIVSTGDVSIVATGGFGSAVSAASGADTAITSVGDLSVDLGAGIGHGISANGLHNTINSQGDITADEGGIVARGMLLYDEGGALAGIGVAETTEITSVGDISTTGNGGPAIVALGDEVTVNSTGTLSTTGDVSAGIGALRNFTYDHELGQGTFDAGATSVSITNNGDITTSGEESYGIAAGATQGTAAVATTGDISTSGDWSHGIVATGQHVTIDFDGSIATEGFQASGVLVADFAMVAGEAEIVGPMAGDVAITGGSVTTSGDGSDAIFALTQGEIAIAVDSVTTTGAGAHGVNATSTEGDVHIVSGEVRTTGAGEVFGISAITNGGGITIESGTVAVASTGADNGRGIHASSGGGDIVINAGTTTGHTRAIYTTTLFEGPELGFTTGNTTITSESATATGGNAIIGQGRSVTLTSGLAQGTANADFTAATIYVSAGAGGATVTADETIAHGFGQYGIQVLSTGDLLINSGSVSTDGQYGNGITAFGDSAITVNSGTISTQGADSHGIFVDGYTEYGSDPVSITSGTITTAGDRSNGIQVIAAAADVLIDSGNITTAGNLGSAILVNAAGAVEIEADLVSVTGAGADPGVRGDGSGYRVEQGGIIVEGGDGAISIAAGTVDVEGQHRYGISVRGNGAIDITADEVTLASADSVAVVARGGAGDIGITTGTVTTTGASGAGVYGETTTGDITIAAGTTRVENEGQVGWFTGDAVVGISQSGSVSVTSEDAFSAALWGSAVYAHGGSVMIDSGKAATTGDGGVAVYGLATSGDATLALGTLTATGEQATGAFVQANNGAASIVTTGDVTVADGYALRGQGAAVSIETGEGTTTSGTTGILVNATGDVDVANLGTVIGTGTGQGSGAISVTTGQGDIDIASNAVESTGDATYGIFAQSVFGNIAIDSGSVVMTGNQPILFEVSPDGQAVTSDTSAIRAFAFNGDVSIRVDDITAAGEHGRGVYALGRNVDVVVDGTIDVSESGVLVSAQAGTANILVNGTIAGDTVGVSVLASQGVVEVAEGASVVGRSNGVALTGMAPEYGFVQFYNSGTVESTEGVAVQGAIFSEAPTDFYIQNNGVLIGGSGIAVLTGAGDDTLELTNLSQITGIADLGDGHDRLVLDLNDDAPADALGEVIATVNVEHLAVDTGTWRAATGNSVYEVIEIEEGARLIVAQDNEFVSVIAPYIELEGQLALELTSDTEPGELTGLVMEGAGSLHLTGPATLLVDDASGLQHTGGTFVENGELLLTTVYGGDIATSGEGVFELAEGGDFTGNLVNDGTFVFSRAGDYDFLGDFTGSGQLDKHGNGTLTFAGLYGFGGTTSVFGGTVAFTGQLAEDTELDLSEGTVDLSQIEGGEQTIAQLSGQGGTLQLGETQLVIQQLSDTVFSGSITGMGSLIKEGEGDLKLNGDGTGFTGTGQVDGGTMSVNGDFSNASFLVNQGGKLGGAGTIGSTQVNDGGTLAPGNSIDTLTVSGDVTFTAASVFEVEVDAAGNSDLLQATGEATLGGASVNVIAASGIYRPLTDYTILTADGGVSGEFGPVDINLAFLDPTLAYSANAVTLRLVRNDIDFSAYGQTANQVAIGNLIEGLGYGNALYDATLTLIDEDVAPSFASLTGEVYPAHSAAVIETAEILRRQTTGAMSGEGAYAWATGLYNNVSSGSGAGDIELVGKGVAGGLGFGGNGFSASLGLGLLDHENGGGDFADGDVTFAIGQLAYTGLAGLSVSVGAQLGWVDGETRRQTSLGTAGGAVGGSIEGDYLQLFGELAYSVPMGSLSVEPFVGLSHVSVEFDGLTETGAPTALAVAGIDRDVTFGDVGVRLSGDAGSGIRPFASAAYRHAWGDRASLATVGFVGAGGTVPIAAAPIAQDAVELSAGLAITRGQVGIEVGYDGTISNEFDSHGLSAGLKFRF